MTLAWIALGVLIGVTITASYRVAEWLENLAKGAGWSLKLEGGLAGARPELPNVATEIEDELPEENTVDPWAELDKQNRQSLIDEFIIRENERIKRAYDKLPPISQWHAGVHPCRRCHSLPDRQVVSTVSGVREHFNIKPVLGDDGWQLKKDRNWYWPVTERDEFYIFIPTQFAPTWDYNLPKPDRLKVTCQCGVETFYRFQGE